MYLFQGPPSGCGLAVQQPGRFPSLADWQNLWRGPVPAWTSHFPVVLASWRLALAFRSCAFCPLHLPSLVSRPPVTAYWQNSALTTRLSPIQSINLSPSPPSTIHQDPENLLSVRRSRLPNKIPLRRQAPTRLLSRPFPAARQPNLVSRAPAPIPPPHLDSAASLTDQSKAPPAPPRPSTSGAPPHSNINTSTRS